MSELEMGRIKLGGFFGPTEKVIFEYKFERPTEAGEVKSINMFKDIDGEQLGKLEYQRNGTSTKLNVFNVLNWSSSRYGEALLEKFLRIMRKEKVRIIEHDMYDTDDKTHIKLTLFKNNGFQVESRGNITGYSQFYLRLEM
jgi:sRNA-binding regulator protein Hfq